MSEAELRTIVEELRRCPAASRLYTDAQRALAADKPYKGKGSLVFNLFRDPKTLPNPTITTQDVPDVAQPNASNVKTGTIWIDANDSRCNVFETLLVELAHLTRRKEFMELVDNATNYTRADFIRRMEESEFQSVKRAAEVWKSCSKGWKCPNDCPTYGNPDDVATLSFEEHWKKLADQHKENYGRLWDQRTR
ncbi:MAG: hypothetical protein ACYC0Y_27800 [Pirellulales bacterium]